jgi:hypothetical protein
MYRGSICSLLVLVATFCGAVSLNEELVTRLTAGEKATNQSIKAIHDEWEIDKFPNFLKSCFMHKMSWELMKLKFQRKVLTSLRAAEGQKPKFVISFTGRYRTCMRSIVPSAAVTLDLHL